MKLRSLLFVPADRPDRFAKAAASGADAIIIDLEDSVALASKSAARDAAAEWLSGEREGVRSFVRVNPEGSGETQADLDAVLPHYPNALLLPKAEGAASVRWLRSLMTPAIADGEEPPILPIATETPAAIFELGSLREVSSALLGVSWGAEDLPAAIGAATSRQEDGSYTSPYELVRSLSLFAAHAAGVAAIDTVFPAIKDEVGLSAYAGRAARDGFTGMLAIHPGQVATINAAFTPTDAQITAAQAIADAFAANPGAGVLQVDGKMVDAPHLKAALAVLARA
ncbi:MAG: CoA ester lyase [Sphingorhabdus sp.]